jgi:Lamin Tail Domain
MNSSSARLLLALSLAHLLACSSSGDDADGGGTGECDLLAGDLVITEVLANPVGEDTGNEYFEIYNASPDAIDAAGLTLVYSTPEAEEEETHVVGELTIDADSYVVLGSAEPDALLEHMDYGFGDDLGSLRNGGAWLELRCGEEEIDFLDYASVEGTDGVAWQLDGEMPPNHVANDDAGNFCLATMEFATDLLGSPGAANEPCDPALALGPCTDEGGERDIVAPAVGDLVITEFMASPAGTDGEQEWFEVYAAADVDLNGLVAGREVGEPGLTVEQDECLRLAAGEHAVFARSSDAAANGGLPEVAATFDFTLVEDGSIYIGVGEQVIDQIAWSAATEGSSTALDPKKLDPEANDDEASWQLCTAAYGDPETGNTGTPGAGNEGCGKVSTGTCMDGGKARPIVAPRPGQILVTEALANPAGTGSKVDPAHEWFEITALGEFDLNGVELGKADRVEQTIESAECLAMTDGDTVVVAESVRPGENGDLPQVDLVKEFVLNNDDGSVFVGLAGEVLHTFSYGNASDGRAHQLDPDGRTICTTPETDPYGGDNLGTPGAENPACEPKP